MNALPPWRAAPPDAPLRMPPQRFDAGRLHPLPEEPGVAAARALLAAGTLAPTAAVGWAVAGALGADGWHATDLLLLPLLLLLFARLAFAAASWALGLGRRPAPAATPGPLAARTALLLPVRNEDPARIAALLEATGEALDAAGAGAHFDLFLLSDSDDPDLRAREEEAVALLRLRRPGGVFLVRRAGNAGRKAGNVAHWVRRHGAAYAHFVVLDADSAMEADTLVALAAAMEADPRAGLIQTVPTLVDGRTRLARMQAWAAAAHGPGLARGLAAWGGTAGNYWGHNAILRTRAFAGAAGLPPLPGRAPFGGDVLSHDFVEAALLRRAGWAVRLLPGLGGSHEEGPPTLAALDARDRRWCQGNLQHLAILRAPGLHPASRLHLLDGVLSYVAAPLWLALVALGALGAALGQAGPGAWPFLAALALLLLPRLAGFRRDPRAALAELALGAALAPLRMLAHARQVLEVLRGRDSGWAAQGRAGETLPWGAALRQGAPAVMLGAALLGAGVLAPAALPWLLPLAGPLLLAPALTRAMAAPDPGGLFATAEDAHPSPFRRRLATLRADWQVRHRPPPAAARRAA